MLIVIAHPLLFIPLRRFPPLRKISSDSYNYRHTELSLFSKFHLFSQPLKAKTGLETVLFLATHRAAIFNVSVLTLLSHSIINLVTIAERKLIPLNTGFLLFTAVVCVSNYATVWLYMSSLIITILLPQPQSNYEFLIVFSHLHLILYK